MQWRTKKRENKHPERWHRWFAWYPVKVKFILYTDDVEERMVWLETVMRKGHWYQSMDGGHGYNWKYAPLGQHHVADDMDNSQGQEQVTENTSETETSVESNYGWAFEEETDQ